MRSVRVRRANSLHTSNAQPLVAIVQRGTCTTALPVYFLVQYVSLFFHPPVTAMVNILATYEGELHCSAVHGPSETTLTTDAPVDNHGRGESFSPTDLVATGLGTCIGTIMGIAAQKMDVDLRDLHINVTKEMASNPRRITRLQVDVYLPRSYDEDTLKRLKRAAYGCPVQESLHPDMDIDLTVHPAP